MPVEVAENFFLFNQNIIVEVSIGGAINHHVNDQKNQRGCEGHSQRIKKRDPVFKF